MCSGNHQDNGMAISVAPDGLKVLKVVPSGAIPHAPYRAVQSHVGNKTTMVIA